MIIEVDNFLTEDELIIYDLMVKDNDFHKNLQLPYNSKDGYINWYHRNFIEISDTIKNKIIKYLKDNFDTNVEIDRSWVNYVFENSNKKDEYHWDNSDSSIIIFLNDDYIGGELECRLLDKSEILIKPKRNKMILLKNKCLHRVKNVLKGKRFTLVIFLHNKQKDKKTMI